MLARRWSHRNAFITCGNVKWYSNFGSRFGSSSKMKLLLPSDPAVTLWYLSKWLENLCSHKNLHTNVYSSFIHGFQSLEAVSLSLVRWLDFKKKYIQIRYYSILKINELWSHKQTQEKLRCILLSARRHSENVALWSQLYDILWRATPQKAQGSLLLRVSGEGLWN